MPNWCFNDERIAGPRDEILPFFEKLESWISSNRMENSFGDTWLGNIVLGAGFKVDGDDGLYCRGSIIGGLELCNTEEDTMWISFSSETAWYPMVEMWNAILERHAPSCSYIFRSEEPGMGCYITNGADGSFFSEDYLVDCCIDNPILAPKGIEAIEGASDEADVRSFLQKFFHTYGKDTDALVKRFNEVCDDGYLGDGNFIQIHRYELVD